MKRNDLKRLLRSQNAPPAAEKIAELVPPKAVDWLRKTGIIREHVPEPLRSRLLGQQMDPENLRTLGLVLPDEADASSADTLEQATLPRPVRDEPAKRAWRDKPPNEVIKTAMLSISMEYSTGSRPTEFEIWGKLRDCLGSSVTRDQARAAINKHAPHLKGQRGRHWPKSSD